MRRKSIVGKRKPTRRKSIPGKNRDDLLGYEAASAFPDRDAAFEALLKDLVEVHPELEGSVYDVRFAIRHSDIVGAAVCALTLGVKLEVLKIAPQYLKHLDRLIKREEGIMVSVAAATAITRISPELGQKVLAEYDRLHREGQNTTDAKKQAAAKYTVGVRSVERLLATRLAKLQSGELPT
jgi:hypothetical protein